MSDEILARIHEARLPLLTCTTCGVGNMYVSQPKNECATQQYAVLLCSRENF